jgi:hypothetical protein
MFTGLTWIYPSLLAILLRLVIAEQACLTHEDRVCAVPYREFTQPSFVAYLTLKSVNFVDLSLRTILD